MPCARNLGPERDQGSNSELAAVLFGLAALVEAVSKLIGAFS